VLHVFARGWPYIRALHVTRAMPFGNKKSSSTTEFESSWRLLHDEATCVANEALI
jgi:hypothetical protein